MKLALFEVVLRKAPLERAISNAPVGLQLQRPIESLRAQPVIVAALAVALLARDVALSVIRGPQSFSEVIRGHQRPYARHTRLNCSSLPPTTSG